MLYFYNLVIEKPQKISLMDSPLRGRVVWGCPLRKKEEIVAVLLTTKARGALSTKNRTFFLRLPLFTATCVVFLLMLLTSAIPFICLDDKERARH